MGKESRCGQVGIGFRPLGNIQCKREVWGAKEEGKERDVGEWGGKKGAMVSKCVD